MRYSRLPNMSVREPSTDPLKEHDISDIINQKDNGPETMAVIEKYNVLRAALAKLREKLVGAKNDAAETRTILAGNMNAPIERCSRNICAVSTMKLASWRPR